MKRVLSVFLAALMCLGLLCALAPQASADDGALVKKGGRAITSADDLKVYDIVTFGTYPLRSYDDFDGIEWIVVKKSGTKVTLLSRYVIDSHIFHNKNEKTTWQSCSLNKWLNDTFKSNAFTTAEQNLINGDITLPSLDEARDMPSDLLVGMFTPYAISRGGDSGRCMWWLRDGYKTRTSISSGEECFCASLVKETGEVLEARMQVNFKGKGVRPQIQIDFDRQGGTTTGGGTTVKTTPAPGKPGRLMKGNQIVTSIDALKMYDDVTFGTYPQEAYDQYDPIRWIVIGKDGTKVRLLSTFALDCQKYQDPYAAISWRFCTLNTWLNEDFMAMAFTAEEQAALAEYITLLSEDEANELPAELLATRSTAYAVERGVDENRCIWWLRDSMMREVKESGSYKTKQMYCASVVHETGSVDRGYYRVDIGHKAVRPVIEVDVSLLPH